MEEAEHQIASLLQHLTSIPAVSGREGLLASEVRAFLSRFCDHVSHDALGNVIGLLKGESNPSEGETRSKVMLAAHMDQIGLLVQRIEKSGALRVAPVGGVNRRNLPAQDVIVHGREALPGLIGTIPPHLSTAEDRKKIPAWEEFFVDVGLPYTEAVKAVRPGDWISFRADGMPLAHGRLTSGALDNRAGLAATLTCAQRLAQGERRCGSDIYVAITAQEELGLRGATTAAYAIAPDAALAIDVGFGDMPDVAERESIVVGDGPALTLGPNIHLGVRRLLVRVAEQRGILLQPEVMAGSSGTDAWAIQTARDGVPTGVVSIPLRYMHSTVECVALVDVLATADLLVGFCEEVTIQDVRRWNGERLAGGPK